MSALLNPCLFFCSREVNFVLYKCVWAIGVVHSVATVLQIGAAIHNTGHADRQGLPRWVVAKADPRMTHRIVVMPEGEDIAPVNIVAGAEVLQVLGLVDGEDGVSVLGLPVLDERSRTPTPRSMNRKWGR